MADRAHLIDGGHVMCPIRRRDVDIEECFSCKHLSDVRIDARHPAIVCDVEPRPIPDELAM